MTLPPPPIRLPEGQRITYTQEFLLGPHPAFEITRSFDSGQGWTSPLGRFHRSNLDLLLRDGPDGGYEFIGPAPYPVEFPKPDPSPGVRAGNASNPHLSLEPLPRAGFRLHDTQAQTRTDFAKFPGRLWYPVAIDHGHGLITRIERNRTGQITAVSHPSGLRLAFDNAPDGLRLGYRVIGIDGSAQQVVAYSYDDDDRMIAAATEIGGSWTWSYTPDTITEQDALGHRRGYHLDSKGRVTAISGADGATEAAITYDDRLRLITVSQEGGRVFQKYWYDAQDRIFMVADALGQISYRRFNDQNLLIAETDPNGATTSYRYDSYGNQSSVIDPEGREVFRVFDDAGNLLLEKTPAGETTRYIRDDAGDLVAITDPMGHRTDIRNDAAGLPVQIMRHDGLIEFRTYDAHHRLVRLIDFNSATTLFEYDAFHRLTAVTDPLGHVSRLIYEPMPGRPFAAPSQIIRPDGVATARTFLPSGVPGALSDGEGRVTRYGYGPGSLLAEITDPKGGRLGFAYDSAERLTRVTNQMGLHWVFERDEAGRVTRETDFDGRTLRYAYDPGGRVIRRDNPDHGWLEYDYDASGLLLELRAFGPGETAPLVTTYGYDENARLITARNADAEITLERDALGRVTVEVVNGQRIESDYDCCGRRVERRIGDQTLRMRYDGMGSLLEWQLDAHAPLHFARDEMGQERRRASAHGFVLDQDWDPVGQLLRQHGPGIGRDYDWSRAYEPLAIADTRRGGRRYEYDPNGQITRTQYSDGRAERFAYTPDLNIAGSGSETERFQNWRTSAAGVVRLARGPRGEAVTLEHDACGRVVRRTVSRRGFRAQTWAFTWNAQDQLVVADGPNGCWRYGYDPFGRRIWKESAGQREAFLWDGDVIARDGTVDWFFEPDSFRPMARAEAGALFYIVNDHLGTPKEAVSEGGTVVWAVDHDTWGTVRPARRVVGSDVDEADYWVEPVAYSEAPVYAAPPEAAFCPIRFQGQWEDAETGLFYNRFRYYEPLVGQYVSADPIGLLGGVRPNSYVINPSAYFDIFGLNPCCAARYRACRPRFRRGVVDKVWQDAVDAAAAQGLDYILDPAGVRIPIDSWNPGQSRVGVWDMGHVPGQEYRGHLRDLERGLITPEEFRRIYNNPQNYRVENPSTNRSHKYEGLPECD